MTQDLPRPLPFRIDALVLVCKACGKRDSGPRDLKPKKLAAEFKSAAKGVRLKTRVVMTSCLGLCPKRAIAVGVVSGDGHGPRQFALESAEQVPGVLAGRPERG